ncbi:MAG: CoA transferase [Hyphomicrobiaceae bacterium]
MSERLPLAGLKVLDVATWIAAPAAAVILADFGADVIKIEQPDGGDPHRQNYRLPHIPQSETNFLWHLDSRNKRSVALDLKNAAARDVLDRLIGEADILITNFPLPVRERLRLTYEDVSRVNPRLIYASFTGYGEDGPDKDQPGYDSTAFFGRAGILDACRYEGQPPSFSLPAQGDRSSAMGLLSGILMALYDRERTGRGSMVASSLLANGLWSNGVMAQAALLDAHIGHRPPRERPRSALANIYETSDGRWLQIAAVREDKLWDAFCRAIERPDIAADPRFAETSERRRNAAVLTAALDPVFRARALEDWRRILFAHNIPHAFIARTADVVDDTQAEAAGIVVPTSIPDMPRTIAAPFQIAGIATRPARPGPDLGADTDGVLGDAGFTPEEIASLRAAGAMG